jgi:hypothetical protein
MVSVRRAGTATEAPSSPREAKARIFLVALIVRSAVIVNVSTMSTVGPVNSIPAFVGDLGRLICQFEKGVIREMLASKGPVPPPNFNAPVAIS